MSHRHVTIVCSDFEHTSFHQNKFQIKFTEVKFLGGGGGI